VWAMPGRFFQSLLVPCGASQDVTSQDVTDSREKRNQGQFDFLRPMWSFPTCNFPRCN